MTISTVAPASTVNSEPPHSRSVVTATPSCMASRLVTYMNWSGAGSFTFSVLITSMRTPTACSPLLVISALNRLFACASVSIPVKATFW